MHACSSVIEHSRHSIQQQQPPSLLLPSSPSSSIQIHVSSNYQFNPKNVSIEHRLSSIEIQLFQTLHYLILHSNENLNQILSLNTIQLFIYLFIPYIQTYLHQNENEFLSNPDLIQGMRLIWQPLFQFQQPNIQIFNTFVKQEQIYSNENNNQYRHLPIVIQSSMQRSLSEHQPLTNLTNTLSMKNKGNSTSLLQLNIQRSSTDSGKIDYNSVHDLSDYKMENNQTKIRAPLVHMNSICSMSDLTRLTMSSQSPGLFKTLSHKFYKINLRINSTYVEIKPSIYFSLSCDLDTSK
jgi:hypothetical protein